MKFSFIIFATMMLYGGSASAILALTSPLAQQHLLAASLALVSGFIGTALFFGELARSESRQQIGIGGRNNVQTMKK